jgi:hypothetical protein
LPSIAAVNGSPQDQFFSISPCQVLVGLCN